jgi:hypothetical protein
MLLGELHIVLTAIFDYVQVGDGTNAHRYTPVSVAGLSSGSAMVALGLVQVFYVLLSIPFIVLMLMFMCRVVFH